MTTTWWRRGLLALTLLAGAGSAVAVASGPAADRAFTAVHAAAQSTMSITVPLFGILLVSDLRRGGGRGSGRDAGRGRDNRDAGRPVTAAALGPVVAMAVAVAGFGIVLSALAVAVVPNGPAESRWAHLGSAAGGGVLVQVLAVLVGAGLGALWRWRLLAFVASVVLPLGLWWLLGLTSVLRPLQGWLTPYANARQLLSGDMTGGGWAQWGVVVLLWGVGLNVWGLRRLRRQMTGVLAQG